MNVKQIIAIIVAAAGAVGVAAIFVLAAVGTVELARAESIAGLLAAALAGILGILGHKRMKAAARKEKVPPPRPPRDFRGRDSSWLLVLALVPALAVGGAGGCQLGEFVRVGGTGTNLEASRITIVDNTPQKDPQAPVASHLPALAQLLVAGGAAAIDPLAGAVVFVGLAGLQGVQNLATVKGTATHAVVGAVSEIEATWSDGKLRSVRITPVSSGVAGKPRGPKPKE